MHRALIGALALTLFAGSALAQTKNSAAESAKPIATGMKPGVWEIVTASETAGSPVKRTTTSRVCYTADDVASLARVLPQPREPGMKCELKDPKLQGASAGWRIACNGKDASLTGTGKMTVGPDAYSGQSELEMKKAGGKPAKVEQKMNAKWIEACK